MPDEQIIEVLADGRVVLNSRSYGTPGQRELPELVATLDRFRQASELTRTPAVVTIQADDQALQQRVIDVLNACAAAKLKNVTFGMGGS
jgi:biopolymer transport protein ExbD